MDTKYVFILICYYNEDEVVSFIHNELGKQQFKEYSIVIVDNGSHNPFILEKETDNNQIFLFTPEKNLGYFGGAEFGLLKYTEVKFELPDFVVISNTDIHFEDAGLLNLMYNKYNDRDEDIFGIDILSSLNGQHQNPYIPERISRKKMEFFLQITSDTLKYNAFLLLYYAKNKLKGILQKTGNSAYSKEGRVYSIHGSFMIFAKSYFLKGGNFSYDSFLFCEEIFIGEVARIKKMNVYYDPSFRIIHREHSTTGVFKKARDVKFMHESYQYILENYY